MYFCVFVIINRGGMPEKIFSFRRGDLIPEREQFIIDRLNEIALHSKDSFEREVFI
jgi:hypothetical protein